MMSCRPGPDRSSKRTGLQTEEYKQKNRLLIFSSVDTTAMPMLNLCLFIRLSEKTDSPEKALIISECGLL